MNENPKILNHEKSILFYFYYATLRGATFGHEITHGFDDQGCKYNAMGNLQNWWTQDDSIKFYTKTKMIVKQFNKYIAVDSLHINGELTQGENIDN